MILGFFPFLHLVLCTKIQRQIQIDNPISNKPDSNYDFSLAGSRNSPVCAVTPQLGELFLALELARLAVFPCLQSLRYAKVTSPTCLLYKFKHGINLLM